MKNEDIYKELTQAFVDCLNEGEIPWQKPWKEQYNMISGKEYEGMNQLYLGLRASKNKWPNAWATFKQINELGGSVASGSKGSIVVWWNLFKRKKEVEGKEVIEVIPTLKYFRVFNLAQTHGIKENKIKQPFDNDLMAEQVANSYLKRENLNLERSNKAFYSPSSDYVGMPNREIFSSQEEYFSTLFHELTHSTGHQSRLNREEVQNFHFFGSETYSKEELTAEIGAAFLCTKTKISNQKTLTNSKAYIQSWIKVLEKNPKWILSASSKAQKAAEFILGE